jgi:predicted 3-demethylubiquinone-9 3-methyltransferase (glyoxalase superfamily)
MQVTTFLMFEGQAEAAMIRYVSLFPNARVVSNAMAPAKRATKDRSGMPFSSGAGHA